MTRDCPRYPYSVQSDHEEPCPDEKGDRGQGVLTVTFRPPFGHFRALSFWLLNSLPWKNPTLFLRPHSSLGSPPRRPVRMLPRPLTSSKAVLVADFSDGTSIPSLWLPVCAATSASVTPRTDSAVSLRGRPIAAGAQSADRARGSPSQLLFLSRNF